MTPTKWEYFRFTFDFDKDDIKEIDAIGENGWELVHVHEKHYKTTGRFGIFIFKRPLIETTTDKNS